MSPLQQSKSVTEAMGIKSARQKRRNWRFVVIWEFRVRTGMEEAFEKAYGANGDWVQLFKQDKAYIGTELIHNFKDGQAYLTLDFWESEEAYDAFRGRHLASYRAIDQKCERMTESEREIGRFARVFAE